MNPRGHFRLLLELAGLLVVASIWIGCGDDSTEPPLNEPPQISLVNPEVAVASGSTVSLSVTVSDPDDDPLAVTWSVTGGSLRVSDQGKTTMQWTASSTLGVDTIRAVVSDGKSSRSVTVEFKIGTKVDADIVGTVNWTQLNSPYIIIPPEIGGESRLAVFQGSQLNIPAGVEILVKNALIFDVAGRLNCRGTSGNPVTFYPNQRGPEAGAWVGFRVQTATQATAGILDMEYAEVAYATRNIHAIDDSKVYLKNTLLLFASEAGLYFESGGDVKLENCEVTDNSGHGIWIDGGYAITPDSVVIVNSEINLNGLTGISINLNDPFGTIPIRIYQSEILRNLAYGIHLLLPVRPTITQNAIYYNDMSQSVAELRRNIVLEDPFSANFPTINATNNYWLTTDPLVIAGSIYDSADLPTEINVEVLYQPFRTVWP